MERASSNSPCAFFARFWTYDDWPMRADYAHTLHRRACEQDTIEEYRQTLRIAPDDARTDIGGSLAVGNSNISWL